ncbi:hypothetical protein BH10BDE1_BH10BDE1_27090 [soil metagenome]
MKNALLRASVSSAFARVFTCAISRLGIVSVLVTSLSACSPSTPEAQVKSSADSSPHLDLVRTQLPRPAALMPRAKTESRVGLPTDLIGNGRLGRGFIKSEDGFRTGNIVGVFAKKQCVSGRRVEHYFEEGTFKGFEPLVSHLVKYPSGILGFDITNTRRGPSIESDLAEFLKGDENTEIVYYNPASYARGDLSLEDERVTHFMGGTCGMAYVKRVAYFGQIFVMLKVTYGSAQDRAKFEQRFRASDIELAKMLIEIRREPEAFRGLVKFSMAAYQLGGDITKLAANFGGASQIECTPDDLSACEAVYKNLSDYATDTGSGFPSQLTYASTPGPLAIPIVFGEMLKTPKMPQIETVM